MATDQGKTSNMNALGIVADTLSVPLREVGTTTFRPPYTPVTFGALAGPHAASCSTRCAARRSTTGRSAGRACSRTSALERAPLLPAGRRRHARRGRARMPRRARHGRRHVRRLDARQDRGRRAATPREFLNRIYTNAWLEARARPLPLRPDAARGRHRHRRRRRRPPRARPLPRDHHDRRRGARAAPGWRTGCRPNGRDLQVYLTSVTEQWAVIAVQGRKRARCSRRWSPTSTSRREPSRTWRARRDASAASPCRLFRVSFTGELGYEINVPGGYGARRLGGARRARRGARHHALRHRGDARAARREGLHHRRPGDRRHGDAATISASTGWSARRSTTSSASARWRARTCARRTASSWSAC